MLADPLFVRAPIQSRLLRYLVRRELDGQRPPSQFEIAVDCLGKNENYALEDECYPRVQMSRLRRSLELYYARNLPGNGLQISLPLGSYRLMLVRAEVRDADRETSSALDEEQTRDILGADFAPMLGVAARKGMSDLFRRLRFFASSLNAR